MRFSNYLAPILLSISIGAIVGVYIHSVFTVAVILGIIGILFLARAARLKYPLIVLVSICIIFFSIGLLRGEILYKSSILSQKMAINIDKYLYLEGVVVNNPDTKKDKQVYIIKVENLKIQVTSPKLPLLVYGAKIRVYGKLRVPENFEVANNKEVRYTALLRARGISLLLDAKRFEIISLNNGNILIAKIYDLKRYVGVLIERVSFPESSLFFSMVFGGKNGLSEDLLNYFQLAGLLHIVVLSGQNLTIVALIATKIFSYSYGFRVGHLLALIAIVIYSIMGGLEAATLRALFMSSLLIIGLILGRLTQYGRILFLSVLCMLIYNPYLLFDDPSFQLSVLAFLGILYISPIIELWLIKNNINEKLSGYIGAIFGAQIAVLPLIAYSSQAITPYAFLANFFSLIVVGIITVYGMISVWVGSLSTHLFDIITIPLTFLLKYIIIVATWISKLPFASINLDIKFWVIALIYILGVCWLYFRWKKEDLTPLALFTLKTNQKQINRGVIPWVPPDDVRAYPDKNINEEKIISWN